MYATVRELTIKKSFKDENVRLVHDELLAEARRIPGFVDYYLVYAEHDTEMSIGFFKDKKGADRYNELAGEFVKENPAVKLTKIFEGPVVVHSRETVPA